MRYYKRDNNSKRWLYYTYVLGRREANAQN